MASQLDMFNAALGRLRVKLVTSTDPTVDTSRQSKALAREFQRVRRTLLGSFPWSFATQRITLEEYSKDDPEPTGTWTGRFKIFGDDQTDYNEIIKVIEVRAAGDGALLDYEWTTDQDENGDYQQWIYTTTTDDIVVTAVVDMDDSSQQPDYFQNVLIWRLAEAVAMELTDSVEKAERCGREAARALLEARLIDMARKRQVARLRPNPAWSAVAARRGPMLAPVEGETPS